MAKESFKRRLTKRGYRPNLDNLDTAMDYHAIAWKWWYIGIQNMIVKKLTMQNIKTWEYAL